MAFSEDAAKKKYDIFRKPDTVEPTGRATDIGTSCKKAFRFFFPGRTSSFHNLPQNNVNFGFRDVFFYI